MDTAGRLAMTPLCALTIAGSDSGGGAGLQADLKTFTVLGVYGASVVTALTAQNTCGVNGIHRIPAAFVRTQLEAVLGDLSVAAAKTGLLPTAAVIRAVARVFVRRGAPPLVVDPVMVAQSGTFLMAAGGPRVLLEELLPLATLVTPNLHEAEVLTGGRIASVAGMRRAARQLIRAGAKACLIKGGHLPGKFAVDVFDDGRHQQELAVPRLVTRHTHGTGCQLSAAITARLASGHSVLDAVAHGKRFITVAIRHGLAIGHGSGPANPMAWKEPGS
jgi:hydroxymethylpyrimidine kinase/phosphomethylpyrimidine kinase